MTPAARKLEGAAYGKALRDTTTAYLAGFMSKPTWKAHVTSLWGTVVHKGIQNIVAADLATDSYIAGLLKGVIK